MTRTESVFFVWSGFALIRTEVFYLSSVTFAFIQPFRSGWEFERIALKSIVGANFGNYLAGRTRDGWRERGRCFGS